MLIVRNGYPVTGLDRPLGLQEVEASRISRRHMEVVRLSVLPTGRLYTPVGFS
jgi:hypothetical protein